MKINSSSISTTYQDVSVNLKQKTDKNEKLSAKDISASYLAQYQLKISQDAKSEVGKQIDVFTLKDIGYDGKAIGDLTQQEAKDLVSEDGFFGIDRTSKRLSDFVLKGAGDDVDMLKAGRDGLVQGFDEAQKLWGGKLPDISQETIKKALDAIDSKLRDLGVSSIDTVV